MKSLVNLLRKTLIVLVAVSAPSLLQAADFEVDGIAYDITSSTEPQTVEVVRKSGTYYSNDVVIPKEVVYDNITYSVTSIGADAFMYCSGLTSIRLPNSIRTIKYGAFSGCTGLTSIEIPNSVTSIEGYAFYQCSGLTSIVVDENNKTYDSRYNCNAIIITNSNALIVGCKNTMIPSDITSIISQAFDGCSGLAHIYIPGSVKYIGEFSFVGCINLNSVNVDENNVFYDSRDYCNAIIETSSDKLIVGCKNTKIPYGVKSIGNQSFSGCLDLTTLKIPESVTTIEFGAFAGCNNLNLVNIPDNITFIDGFAFSACALDAVEIPKNVSYIGFCAFDCTSLSSIRFNGLTPPEFDGGGYYNVDKSIPVYVPCQSFNAYKKILPDFTNIQCFQVADPVNEPIDEPVVKPENKSVEIIWPVEEGAEIYVITITIGGNPFCTLTFDSKGLLLNIEYAASEPTTKSAPVLNAELTVYGYKFNITGLTEGTEYGYTVSALDVNGNVLKEYEGSFKTNEEVAVEENLADKKSGISESVLVNGNTISVEGIDASDVRIFNTAGKQVPNPVPNAGVYVVTVGGEAVKVVVP